MNYIHPLNHIAKDDLYPDQIHILSSASDFKRRVAKIMYDVLEREREIFKEWTHVASIKPRSGSNGDEELRAC